MINSKTKNKKSDDDEIVTKGFLRSELMKAFKKELTNYPTKNDLKAELALYATKNDLYDLENRIDLKFDSLRNDIMQFKDDMVSMFLDLKTEIISMKALYDKHDEEIKNLAIR